MLGPAPCKPRQCEGLGGATSGDRIVSWRIRVSRGQHLTGEVRSSEISKTDRYMLLSLQAQNTLGIVKHTAVGTRYFSKSSQNTVNCMRSRIRLASHLLQ